MSEKENSLPKLSLAEQEIMKIVWDADEEVTIKHVWQTINKSREDQLSRTTVQVQMARLESKQWLKMRQQDRQFFYSSTRDAEQSQSLLIEELANRVFDSSFSKMVKCLLQSKKLKKNEMQQIQDLLDDF